VSRRMNWYRHKRNYPLKITLAILAKLINQHKKELIKMLQNNKKRLNVN
jgi:hypothetical protein